MFAREMDKSFQRLGLSVAFEFLCHPGKACESSLDELLATRPAAALVVAGPHDSAALVRGLRARGYRGPIFGSPAMGRRQFAVQAGEAAEGSIFPLLYDPHNKPSSFAEKFQSERGYFARLCGFAHLRRRAVDCRCDPHRGPESSPYPGCDRCLRNAVRSDRCHHVGRVGKQY